MKRIGKALAIVFLVIGAIAPSAVSEDDSELRLLHDEMVVAFSGGETDKAKAIAQDILERLPEGKKDYDQCRLVLADESPPKERLYLQIRDEVDVEALYQMPPAEQRSFLLRIQTTRLPEGFETWETRARVEFLVESLSAVWAQQQGMPGGVDLTEDIFVHSLIEIGDPAVPRLIEALEKDERLTRATHFWRSGVGGTILSVREAALTALMSILRVPFFEAASTGSNFTNSGEGGKAVLEAVRNHWEKYGHLPFDERMVEILRDPNTDSELRRMAAWNLGSLGENRTFSTTVWTERAEALPHRPNPAIEKFSNPTAAEAILAALDIELVALYSQGGINPRTDRANESRQESGGPRTNQQRENLARSYLDPLALLGDVRIIPEIKLRFQDSNDSVIRLHFANALGHLGNSEALDSLAHDLETGRWIDVGEEDPDDLREVLDSYFRILTQHDVSGLDRAMAAFTSQDHVMHDLVKEVLIFDPRYSDGGRSFGHNPIYSRLATLDFLANQLENSETFPGIPETDVPGAEIVTWQIRHGAARALRRFVFGFPNCDPREYAGQEGRFLMAIHWFEENRNDLRPFAEAEINAIRWAPLIPNGLFPLFLPDYNVLDLPATEKDVKDGRAAFHLKGTGRVASLELPAVGFRKLEADLRNESPVFVFQAERDSEGNLYYGGIDYLDGLRKIPATFIERLVPIGEER